ncbi:MAG: hypothetical protein FWG42_03950 [Clostridiales bacterium]|nr:hypothetical protein [Clostridiales bacterium]
MKKLLSLMLIFALALAMAAPAMADSGLTIKPDAMYSTWVKNADGVDVFTKAPYWLEVSGPDYMYVTAYLNNSYVESFWVPGPFSSGYLQLQAYSLYPYLEGKHHLSLRDGSTELATYDFIVCSHAGEMQEKVITEASCEEPGLMGLCCITCGLAVGDVAEVPALGHDYVEGAYTLPTKESDGYWTYACSRCGDSYEVMDEGSMISLTGTVAAASVEKLSGSKNNLCITVTEYWSDGSETCIEETVSISNNSVGTYAVGEYSVYVETKGNDQVRTCSIV